MKNLATSPSSRKWQSYNRWRSKHRELDKARRLEKAAQKQSDYVSAYQAPKLKLGRRSAAWATITIQMRDGAKSKLRIGETPFGLSMSPTMAGKKITKLLLNYRPTPA